MDSPLLLSHLPDCEPSSGLLEKTLGILQRKQRQQLYIRFSLAAASLLNCIGYGLWQSQAFRAELQTSPFFGFMKLAISDPDILFRSLTDFSLGLLESLPLNLFLFGSISILCLLVTMHVFQDLLRKPSSFPRLSLH